MPGSAAETDEEEQAYAEQTVLDEVAEEGRQQPQRSGMGSGERIGDIPLRRVQDAGRAVADVVVAPCRAGGPQLFNDLRAGRRNLPPGSVEALEMRAEDCDQRTKSEQLGVRIGQSTSTDRRQEWRIAPQDREVIVVVDH